MIRTLQFDKKRFLVATIENNIAVDHVFYTDHYTKAGYLVRFAATQHRFMIKSRFWWVLAAYIHQRPIAAKQFKARYHRPSQRRIAH